MSVSSRIDHGGHGGTEKSRESGVFRTATGRRSGSQSEVHSSSTRSDAGGKTSENPHSPRLLRTLRGEFFRGPSPTFELHTPAITMSQLVTGTAGAREPDYLVPASLKFHRRKMAPVLRRACLRISDFVLRISPPWHLSLAPCPLSLSHTSRHNRPTTRCRPAQTERGRFFGSDRNSRLLQSL